MRAPNVAEIQRRIRESGLRATPARIAVLGELFGAAAPMSHAEVADRLAAKPWDRATIYRNLLDMAEVDLVRRTDLGDHVWRFEVAQEGHDHAGHPHFVCTDCGNVECLPSKSITLSSTRAAPAALRAREVEVQVRGLCDRCNGPATSAR